MIENELNSRPDSLTILPVGHHWRPAVPRFAANLSMMFGEHEFLDRFEAAAKAGFTGVEFLFPYDFKASEIAARLADNGLKQALFNMPPGDWEKGERGIAALPGREQEFADGVAQALEYAEVLDCPRIHLMGGIIHDGNRELVARSEAEAVYVSNLSRAAELAASASRTIIIEPINTRDIPGYFVNYQADAIRYLDQCGADNVGLQFDLYHCQIMEGDIAMHMRELLPRIRHMQIAGVPDRHEPDLGEVNYPYLFAQMDQLGYEGWVGCEYRPAAETNAGLDWFKEALKT